MLSLSMEAIALDFDPKTEEDGFRWQPYLEYGFRGAKTLDGKILVPAKYDECTYENGYFRVITPSKFNGIFSRKGKVIIRPNKYLNIIPVNASSDTPFKVIGSNGWGLVSSNGKYLIPEEYDYIGTAEDNEKNRFFILYKSGFTGIATIDGKILIPADKYTDIIREGTKKEGYTYPFVIRDKGQTISGVCDATGKELIRTNYNQTFLRRDIEGTYFKVQDGNSEGKLSINGDIIKQPNPTVYKETKYAFKSKLKSNKWILVINEKNKSGALSVDGDTIVPFCNDFIDFDKKGNFFRVKVGRFQGAYSYKGDLLVNPTNRFLSVTYDDAGYLCAMNENHKSTLFTMEGQQLFVPTVKYLEVHNGSDFGYKGSFNPPIWCKENGKCGIIDFSGKTILPCIYDNVFLYFISDDYYLIPCLNGRRGFYTKEGHELIPIEYDDVERVVCTSSNGEKQGFIRVKNGDKVGFFTLEGISIINAETFNIIQYLDNKTFRAITGKRICIFDINGNLLSDNLPEVQRDELITKADAAFSAGNYKDAGNYYGEAITLRESASAYFNRGICYYNRSKYYEAINDFEHCLQTDPSNNLKVRAIDLIGKARFYQEEKDNQNEQLAGAILGLVFNVANSYFQAKNNYNRNSNHSLSRNSISASDINDSPDESFGSSDIVSKPHSKKVCRICKGGGECLSCHGTGLRTDNQFGTGVDPTHKCGVCGGDGVCNICGGSGYQ